MNNLINSSFYSIKSDFPDLTISRKLNLSKAKEVTKRFKPGRAYRYYNFYFGYVPLPSIFLAKPGQIINFYYGIYPRTVLYLNRYRDYIYAYELDYIATNRLPYLFNPFLSFSVAKGFGDIYFIKYNVDAGGRHPKTFYKTEIKLKQKLIALGNIWFQNFYKTYKIRLMRGISSSNLNLFYIYPQFAKNISILNFALENQYYRNTLLGQACRYFLNRIEGVPLHYLLKAGFSETKTRELDLLQGSEAIKLQLLLDYRNSLAKNLAFSYEQLLKEMGPTNKALLRRIFERQVKEIRTFDQNITETEKMLRMQND